jgi:hypothetical protein
LSIASLLLLIFLLQSGVLLTGDAGALGRILTDIATFGPCWLLGFAHRDGMICRLRPAVVCCVALAALVLGGWYAYSHPTAQGYDLGEIPFAQAYWSFGFVLLLLRFQPRSMAWLTRVRWLDRVVSFFNARAVTIYLWHEVALIASVAVIVWMWSVPFLAHSLPLGSNWWKYTLTWPLLCLPVLVFGWAEDIAARRRPRLWPWSDDPLNRRRRRHGGDEPLR